MSEGLAGIIGNVTHTIVSSNFTYPAVGFEFPEDLQTSHFLWVQCFTCKDVSDFAVYWQYGSSDWRSLDYMSFPNLLTLLSSRSIQCPDTNVILVYRDAEGKKQKLTEREILVYTNLRPWLNIPEDADCEMDMELPWLVKPSFGVDIAPV